MVELRLLPRTFHCEVRRRPAISAGLLVLRGLACIFYTHLSHGRGAPYGLLNGLTTYSPQWSALIPVVSVHHILSSVFNLVCCRCVDTTAAMFIFTGPV